MKRIVVPTDFSECSMSALKVATQIADKIDAVISIVHTYELPIYGFTSGQLMYDGNELGKVKQEINEELQRIADLDFIQDQTVERFLLPEYSVDQIVEHELLKTADLIVMGTNGTNGVGEDIIGSNTEKIIRKSECPVLAIREGAEKTFNPHKMVFASTFYGEVYDRFDAIKKFAQLFNSEIHLLHVNTPSDFMTTEVSDNLMNSFKEKFGLSLATINVYNDETIEDGVLNFSRRIGADIIAMETHGRTGIKHILNGSITEDVANHTRLPVLTFKIKKQKKGKGVIFPDA
jgi:nucleotide-binding universal stress UspA family protein